MSELEDRNPSEWVLLANPILDPERRVHGGTLLYHGKDRNDVTRKYGELKLSSAALIFVGPEPEGMVYVL